MIADLAPLIRAAAPTEDETATVRALIEIATAIDGMTGPERNAGLIALHRSAWAHPALCQADGIVGRILREGVAAMDRALAKITPGRIWDATPYSHKRKTIARALRIDPAERFSGYATAPFRILQTAEDEHWIAGAIGCPPYLKGARAMIDWCHLDIQHVVLWNPRTGELRVMGEARTATTIVMPADAEERLTVHADGYEFFRGWADRRASCAASHLIAKQRGWSIIETDAADSSIPGALVIGDMAKVRWSEIGASVLVAGPGVDAKRLDQAVWRSARLPRVEAAPEQRRAA